MLVIEGDAVGIGAQPAVILRGSVAGISYQSAGEIPLKVKSSVYPIRYDHRFDRPR